MNIIDTSAEWNAAFDGDHFDLAKWETYIDRNVPGAKALCLGDMRDTRHPAPTAFRVAVFQEVGDHVPPGGMDCHAKGVRGLTCLCGSPALFVSSVLSGAFDLIPFLMVAAAERTASFMAVPVRPE